MGSVYVRHKKLWLAYKDHSGKRVLESSGFAVGQEKQARELLRIMEAQVAAGAAVTGKDGGPVTLAAYVTRFHERREGRIGAADSELQNLRNHVEPTLGAMAIADIRPRHVRDLVLALRKGGELAPGTIRHVYGVLRRLMREALMDELIATNPCDMPAGVLPERVDKDPEWREAAVYTRGELEQLLSDPRIPLGRRVLYALKGLGALRHGEAAGLRWRHYDGAAAPLGALTVANSYLRKGTKTGVTRRMPVHPVLAALLAEWKLSGWAVERGRAPEAEDLIVPNARGKVKDSHEAQDQLVADLKLLELRTDAGEYRSRGGHDLRATFISLAAEDGAVPDIIERGTHAPRRTVRAGYQRFTWPAICAEVAKLRVTLRTSAEVVELPIAAQGGGAADAVVAVSMLTSGSIAPVAAVPPLQVVGAASDRKGEGDAAPAACYTPRYSPPQGARTSAEKRKPPAAPWPDAGPRPSDCAETKVKDIETLRSAEVPRTETCALAGEGAVAGLLQVDPVAETLRSLVDHWERYRDVGELERVLGRLLERARVLR